MKYVYDPEQGKVVPITERKTAPQSHAVHQDSMDACVHPCTGEMIDSKSKFRQITRAHGCTEVGDQKIPAASSRGQMPSEMGREHVERAKQKVEAGYRPEQREADRNTPIRIYN